MNFWGAPQRRTFAAFSLHNFRLYFLGQVVSVSGTWMQRVAQSWLVLELTDSGIAVGVLTAVQFLPLLLLAPTGGLIADRMDKRKLLFVTQSLSGLIALTLGGLVLADTLELWMVFVLAGALGVVGILDNPARQAFLMEMVGRSRLTSAVALNQVLVSSARIIGPAVAGVLIVAVGIGWCFMINAISYGVFIAALAAMNPEEMRRPDPEPRLPRQVREAMQYVRKQPALLTTLVISAVFGVFVYEFEVSLLLLARVTFGGDAETFAAMFAAMGFGAMMGGLYVASKNPTQRLMLMSGYALAASLSVTALAPSLWLSYVALVLVGATAVGFLIVSNSVLLLGSEPRMRGRVVGLRAMTVVGARPIGAPIVGFLGEHFGPRWALGLGAAALIVVCLFAPRFLEQRPTRIDPSYR